jgi:hypothetical protein
MQLKPWDIKRSPGISFGNVLEAYYQETVIRKKKILNCRELTPKLPAHLRNEVDFTI